LIGLDRRIIANFDWVLMILTLLLAGAGLVNLYSASAQSAVFLRQFYWLLLGLGAMFIVVIVPYNRLEPAAYFLWALNVLALAAVLVSGRTVGGSQRWLAVGPIHIQPSELMKLTLILALARFCQRRGQWEGLGIRDLAVPFLLTIVPAVLILKQPDLGTALLLVAIAASVLLFHGILWQTLAVACGGVLALAPLVWRHLKLYQKQRVLTFFDPEKDPLGAGYHIIQSKIAVGSGRLWGAGFTEGSQSQLHFLPEQHTDFAFSVLAEEWGFIGGVVVLGLFGLLLFWGLAIASQAKDHFARLVGVGVVAVFFLQVLINTGMVTGSLPVVGIPLPFISYGGSSAVVNLMALGLLMNISMRRFIFTR